VSIRFTATEKNTVSEACVKQQIGTIFFYFNDLEI
jgi:hypothetical protein